MFLNLSQILVELFPARIIILNRLRIILFKLPSRIITKQLLNLILLQVTFLNNPGGLIEKHEEALPEDVFVKISPTVDALY